MDPVSAFRPESAYLRDSAGAAISAQHIHDLRAALPHVRFISMYGPTECKGATYLPMAVAKSVLTASAPSNRKMNKNLFHKFLFISTFQELQAY